MSKRVILEIVNSNGSGTGQNSDGNNSQPGRQLPGVNKSSGILREAKTKEIFSAFGKGLKHIDASNKVFDMLSNIKTNDEGINSKRLETMELIKAKNAAVVNESLDKSAELSDAINNQYKEDALKAQVTAVKSTLKSTNAKIAPVLHYSTQLFALYHKNQMNTFQMSGMTSASIRQQQFSQGISLAREITTTSIAFMINPILGATQLLMTAIDRVTDYHERSRQFEYSKAKDEYSANYYRNRMVNNVKVVI